MRFLLRDAEERGGMERGEWNVAGLVFRRRSLLSNKRRRKGREKRVRAYLCYFNQRRAREEEGGEGKKGRKLPPVARKNETARGGGSLHNPLTGEIVVDEGGEERRKGTPTSLPLKHFWGREKRAESAMLFLR